MPFALTHSTAVGFMEPRQVSELRRFARSLVMKAKIGSDIIHTLSAIGAIASSQLSQMNEQG